MMSQERTKKSNNLKFTRRKETPLKMVLIIKKLRKLKNQISKTRYKFNKSMTSSLNKCKTSKYKNLKLRKQRKKSSQPMRWTQEL